MLDTCIEDVTWLKPLFWLGASQFLHIMLVILFLCVLYFYGNDWFYFPIRGFVARNKSTLSIFYQIFNLNSHPRLICVCDRNDSGSKGTNLSLRIHSFMNVRKICSVHKEAQFPDCLRGTFSAKKICLIGLVGKLTAFSKIVWWSEEPTGGKCSGIWYMEEILVNI